MDGLIIRHLEWTLHLLVDLPLPGGSLREALILRHLSVDLLIIDTVDLRVQLRAEALELVIVR